MAWMRFENYNLIIILFSFPVRIMLLSQLLPCRLLKQVSPYVSMYPVCRDVRNVWLASWSVCAGLFWNILFIEMWHFYSLSGERMNRLECGLFQITQDSCRCNIDGFQLITGLYNSGKLEQNDMSFFYSFCVSALL